jgi:hypothetical protein
MYFLRQFLYSSCVSNKHVVITLCFPNFMENLNKLKRKSYYDVDGVMVASSMQKKKRFPLIQFEGCMI